MVILCIQSLSLISDGSRSDVKVNVPISGGSGSSSLIDELNRISKLPIPGNVSGCQTLQLRL